MERPDNLRISDFNYHLPNGHIAQRPLPERDQSKLLFWNKGAVLDHRFTDLPALLNPDTCLVVNNTRVIHARIKFPHQNGQLIEVFCLAPTDGRDPARTFAAGSHCQWSVLIGNNRKWKSGALRLEKLDEGGSAISLVVERAESMGTELAVNFSWVPRDKPFSEVIELFGSLPIPPYLNRETEDDDLVRYQTLYAKHEGSVAAPTAGLHFTDRIFSALHSKGISCQAVTLHVGAGTFRPVKAVTMAGHQMHSERISIDGETLDRLSNARQIVPVGTTSMRTLESVYWAGLDLDIQAEPRSFFVEQWRPYNSGGTGELPTYAEVFQRISDHLKNNGLTHFEGHTQLLIAPSYQFRVCKGLITNFHQPQSTLLLLVAAFVGPGWKQIYNHALANNYRFLSYGDSSLLLP